jgi:hypothetical protein
MGVLNKFAQRFLIIILIRIFHRLIEFSSLYEYETYVFNKQGFSNFRKFISKVELAELKKIDSLKGVENCHWNYEFDGLITYTLI